MTITKRVRTTFFGTAPATTTATASATTHEIIRLPPTVVVKYMHEEQAASLSRVPPKPRSRPNLWSVEEHERFLRGLELYPQGPWKKVAAIVETKTVRQTMTHAQKYRQKIERRSRGLSFRGPRRQQPPPISKMPSAPVKTTSQPPLEMETNDALVDLFPSELPPAIQNIFDAIEPFPLEVYPFTAQSPQDISGAEMDSTILDEDLTYLLEALDPMIVV